MNRVTKLAAWTTVWAALAAGPGCAMFDDCCCCDDGRHTAEYTREPLNPDGPIQRAPEVTRTTAEPTPAAPGVY